VSKERALHPIQVVARRTGLNVELLRAWERRYGVVAPKRHESGKRMYSDEDIARLSLLRRAVQHGLRIKEAAARTDEELRECLQAGEETPPHTVEQTKGSDAAHLLEQCKAAVSAFDAGALERALQRARVELSMPSFIEDLLGPLIAWTGHAWSEGKLRIFEEHLVTRVVRTEIATELRNVRGDVATLVVTTPAGETHELGALLVALAASTVGWRVEYLGPDLPASEIAAAANRLGARAVALSVVMPSREGRLASELRTLRRSLSPDTALFIGGRGLSAHAAVLEEVGATVIQQPGQLAEALAALPL
jgi:DNA-binding transcriptional MerR regulator/methylmalonyl-CoA mutase cobalamin-binding subunit